MTGRAKPRLFRRRRAWGGNGWDGWVMTVLRVGRWELELNHWTHRREEIDHV